MQIFNAHGAPVCEGLEKNCSRCGEDFVDYSDCGCMRVCKDCKKPKLHTRVSRESLFGKPLSKRQIQICWMVAEAKLNKEIALDLHLGEGTIKVFMSEILAKTGCPNRTALALYWIRLHGFPILVAAASG